MPRNNKNNRALRIKLGKPCSNCGQIITGPENNLGSRVKFLRLGTGLTMRGLARELSISRPAVRRIEKNIGMKVKTLLALAEYFNVTLDYLVYGEK